MPLLLPKASLDLLLREPESNRSQFLWDLYGWVLSDQLVVVAGMQPRHRGSSAPDKAAGQNGLTAMLEREDPLSRNQALSWLGFGSFDLGDMPCETGEPIISMHLVRKDSGISFRIYHPLAESVVLYNDPESLPDSSHSLDKLHGNLVSHFSGGHVPTDESRLLRYLGRVKALRSPVSTRRSTILDHVVGLVLIYDRILAYFLHLVPRLEMSWAWLFLQKWKEQTRFLQSRSGLFVIRFLDHVAGAVMGHIILNNISAISALIKRVVHTWTISELHVYIQWLMSWPAGLKLNSAFGKSQGELFQVVILIDGEIIDAIFDKTHFGTFVLYLFGFSGICLGASITLGLGFDLLCFLTAHVTFLQYVSRRIYAFHQRCISVFFRLFRGRRLNVLMHGRIDRHQYDTEQLLLGTILFAIFISLFPTTAAYYLLFTAWRVILEWGIGSVVWWIAHDFFLFAHPYWRRPHRSVARVTFPRIRDSDSWYFYGRGGHNNMPLLSFYTEYVSCDGNNSLSWVKRVKALVLGDAWQ